MSEIKFPTGKFVGNGHPPYVSAEINTGHFGNVELAVKAVEAARNADCDCIKFQSWKPESLFTSRYLADHRIERRMFERLSLGYSELKELSQHAASIGIDFCSTPYSFAEVDELISLENVPFIKIASMDINNHEFLRYAGSTGIPIVLSTGMAEMDEVRRGVASILSTGNRDLVLLHCTSVYPTADEELNLLNVQTFRAEFPDVVVGYSDHSLGVLASPIAVGMGAALLEKHFTLDKSKPGFDNSMALNVDELSTFVRQCKLAGEMLGSPDRHVSDAEKKSRSNMRRSIYVNGPIREGEPIRREHLQLKRPAAGLGPDQLDRVIGRVAKVDLVEGDMVTEDLLG